MKAVCSDLAYVKSCCPPGVYKSVWDRLCEQLFGLMPAGMNGEEEIPEIDVWKNGVALVSDADPFSFTITTDDDETPKTGDIVEYKGQFYIIGEVDA